LSTSVAKAFASGIVHNANMPTSVDAAKPATPPKKSAASLALERLGLRRPIDLALHVPFRYEDETQVVRLADAVSGRSVQFMGVVVRSEVSLRPRRQLQVTVQDGELKCTLRFFNFYGNQQKMMSVGRALRVRGELKGSFFGLEMVHPTVKPAEEAVPHELTPVYPTTAGLPQAYLRKAAAGGLARAQFDETIPAASLQRLGLDAHWTLQRALHFLHHPTPDTSLTQLEDKTHPAWQRLKAEELLAQQLAQIQARSARDAQLAPALRPSVHTLVDGLLRQLPFELTGAQTRVGQEIAADLARTMPMNRLLQGDVGSGKTIVAALAACVCIEAGWQCALMAPTEILAEQHFDKLVGWLQPLLNERGKSVAWLAGAQKKKQRQTMLEAVASGEAGLVVGTHALIQDAVHFARLGLAVVDEQHRFGVEQRLTLRRKLSQQAPVGAVQDAPAWEPHLLMMTATPIPRTLAMTLYADLDVSTLDELPPGRTPVVTRAISMQRRDEVLQRIAAQVESGRQAYWVCPLIEDSEALDLQSATQAYAQVCEALGQEPCESVLKAESAPRAALLHARLPVAEKKAVMAAFVAGAIGVLVSTTVIEVGVDVPNASLMVVEHAERFGLSQLHQLRGRVGRGVAASACVLLYDSPMGPIAKQRLHAMVNTHDGFELARVDLALRGPGEFLGARQSGSALLRFADLETDEDILMWARDQAQWMLQAQPELAQRHLDRWMGSKSEFLKA
jgi:ATP-dependent DNA helicase RecG